LSVASSAAALARIAMALLLAAAAFPGRAAQAAAPSAPECREDPDTPWKKNVGVKVSGPALTTFGINSGPLAGPFRIFTWVDQRPMKFFPADYDKPFQEARKRHAAQLKEAARVKKEAAGIDDKEDALIRETQRRDAALRREWDKTRARIDARIDKLDNKMAALIAERERALDELRRGRFCSKCHRTASEIWREDHQEFNEHLGKVKGDPVPAPDWVIAEKAKEYDDKIAALSGQRDDAVKEGHSEHDRASRAIAELWKSEREQLDRLDEEGERLEKSAKELAAKAEQELKLAEKAKEDGQRKNREVESDCTFKKASRNWGVFIANDASCPQRFDFNWVASGSALLGKGLGASWQGGQHQVKCLVDARSQCDADRKHCSCDPITSMQESDYVVSNNFGVEIWLHEVQPGEFPKSPAYCKDQFRQWQERQKHGLFAPPSAEAPARWASSAAQRSGGKP
jgi:hypothetical protein